MPPPWVPSQLIAPTTLSDADAMDVREAKLKNEADVSGLVDPPVVDLVRWSAQTDYGPNMAACLQNAGFNAQGAGGSLNYPDGIGAAQLSAFNLAFYTCDSKYTLNPIYGLKLTSAQWGLRYDYSVEWLVPCLASLGFTATPPPTRATYVAQGLQNSVQWWPWSEADAVFSRSWDHEAVLIQTCPPDPPSQYMWGS